MATTSEDEAFGESFSRLLEPAIHQRKEGSSKLYDRLVSQLLDTEIGDEKLLDIVGGVEKCLLFLGREHESLVRAFMKLDWLSRSAHVAEEYCNVLVDLVAVQTYATKSCIEMLVSCLNIPPECNKTDEELTRGFSSVHTALKLMLKVIPTGVTIVYQSCVKFYPFMNKPTNVLTWYVRNLIRIIEYRPELAQGLLDLIVDNMLRIDVELSRDSLEMLKELDEAGDTQFQLEIKEPEVITDRLKGLSEKLDTLMVLMFEYIHNTCFSGNRLQMKETKVLFGRMEKTFSSIVLRTYNCSHVQYLMFYIASFDQSLCERMLHVCWNHIQDPNVPVVISKISCSYIGDLLTKATFVRIKTVKKWLKVLVGFIHQYIDAQDGDVHMIVAKHQLFHGICQTVFYIVVHCHMDIVTETGGLSYLHQLNFERIVMSRLNPLRFCLPSIAQLFARVTRFHQIAFCYTVIERNSRVSVGFACESSKHKSKKDTLSSHFFPFAPYLLKGSGALIQPLYNQRNTLLIDTSTKTSVEEDYLMDEVVRSFEDHMDITQLHEHSMMELSISPGFGVDMTF